jgi:very-short-patch-repair endonuclease
LRFAKFMAPEKFRYAREMRRKPTPAEAKLWDRLRNRQLDGTYWRHQSPILGYIADFYCAKQDLVVEVDGGYHADRIEYDRHRDEVMDRKGLRVLRFDNSDVLEDIDSVVETIGRYIN